MALEPSSQVDRIKSDPAFQELVSKRKSFAYTLAALMFLIYFGFIFTIAFDKQFLAKSIAGGVTTLGMPIGVLVILSAFILTGIYVWRANGEFDEMTKKIIERMKK